MISKRSFYPILATILWNSISTLVCQIDVHARLLILKKKSPLHGLIWVCTFNVFLGTFPPARLFRPKRLFGTLEYSVFIGNLRMETKYVNVLVPNQNLKLDRRSIFPTIFEFFFGLLKWHKSSNLWNLQSKSFIQKLHKWCKCLYGS